MQTHQWCFPATHFVMRREKRIINLLFQHSYLLILSSDFIIQLSYFNLKYKRTYVSSWGKSISVLNTNEIEYYVIMFLLRVSSSLLRQSLQSTWMKCHLSRQNLLLLSQKINLIYCLDARLTSNNTWALNCRQNHHEEVSDRYWKDQKWTRFAAHKINTARDYNCSPFHGELETGERKRWSFFTTLS